MSSMPSGKQQPARPTISPVSSPPSRSISFASPASPPASRPMSPLTKRMSNTPSLSGLGKELEASAAPKPLWADAQEERLVYVRAELKKAQRRWSESQEIWLKEEHDLLELKRLHQKALRKERAAAAQSIWRGKTWGRRRISSLRSSRRNSSANASPIETSTKESLYHNDFVSDSPEEDDGFAEDENTLNDSDDGDVSPDTEDDELGGDSGGQKLEQVSSNSSSLSSALRRLSFSVRSKRVSKPETGTATPTEIIA